MTGQGRKCYAEKRGLSFRTRLGAGEESAFELSVHDSRITIHDSRKRPDPSSGFFLQKICFVLLCGSLCCRFRRIRPPIPVQLGNIFTVSSLYSLVYCVFIPFFPILGRLHLRDYISLFPGSTIWGHSNSLPFPCFSFGIGSDSFLPLRMGSPLRSILKVLWNNLSHIASAGAGSPISGCQSFMGHDWLLLWS
ncbi:MAG: hypothetical protein XE01_0409 [Synergistales bacterium 58_81]|nr:MAG: hypothetical protein XE01_0409 [Synergistales bacterium 58_81]